MTDEQIADALVRAEILERHGIGEGFYYLPDEDGFNASRSCYLTSRIYDAAEALADWRVAGACLEAWPEDAGFAFERDDREADWKLTYFFNAEQITDKNLTRYICERFAEALP